MILQPGNIKVYTFCIAPLDDATTFSHYYEMMTDVRRCKIDKVGPIEKKKLSLGAGILLDRALADHGLNIQELSEKEGKNGKPYIEGLNGLYYNLSHSGDRVMLSLASEEIGCDIQKKDRNNTSIAKRCYAPDEQEYVFAIDEESTVSDRFFEVWSKKEAYIKYTGEGMRREFRSFSVFDSGENFWYKDEPCYSMSCCMKSEISHVEIAEVII